VSAAPLIDESFRNPALDQRLCWRHEPPRWQLVPERGVLRVEPAARTDLWRTTHYGFDTDNAHLLSLPVCGDFVLTTHVRAEPQHRYDQAGLAVRISPSCWLKTSIEHEPDGPSRLGAVVTNAGYSDWSTQSIDPDRRGIWLRVRREATDYLTESSADGAAWTQIRMAHLLEDRAGLAVEAGIYACSPVDAGFVAEFSTLRVDAGRIA
jgi:regulation of enolase protein 1 (concanavalin A-like superfamily)